LTHGLVITLLIVGVVAVSDEGVGLPNHAGTDHWAGGRSGWESGAHSNRAHSCEAMRRIEREAGPVGTRLNRFPDEKGAVDNSLGAYQKLVRREVIPVSFATD
jgi:hypothetical protein